MKAQLFRNEGGRRFVDLSESSGDFFRRPLLGRGLATGDFNDDGHLDMVVSNIRDRAALLLNRTTDSGGWLGFDFIGRRSPRGALNVKVEVRRGSTVDRYEQHSGGGFLSSSDPRYILGLGKAGGPDEVVVHWPSGRRQVLAHPDRNRYHVVIEPLDDLP
jgi:ASPIC and UnbV.